MISIHELFENGELILQETLIDSIFKYIDYGGLEEKIDDDVLLVLRDNAGSKFEVDLQYRQNQDSMYKVLVGEYVKPNKILIYIPKNQKDVDKISNKELINVFLHEFSHMITDRKIPSLITYNGKPIKSRLLPPPFGQINFEDNKDKIKPLLDYMFQLREMPNFAFSIGFDLINYTKLTTEELYQKNRFIIKQEKETVERDIYYYNLVDSLKTFFELQYFTNKYHKLEYSRKFIKMRKMIEKYRRRLKIYTRTI